MNTRLRSVLLTASIITASFSAVTYTSCSEEKCAAIVCANGSVCNEGSCICPSGYEGSRCETVNRDRFLGNWSVVEDGTISAPANYSVVVEKGSGITEVTLKNFRNYYTSNVKGRVKGDTLYIDPQDVPASGGQTSNIEGKAYLTKDQFYGINGKLVVNYRATTSGLVDDYGFDANNADSKPSVWHK